MMMEDRITVESAVVSYGRTEVLSGAWMELRRGEITSIAGRNGCGKTTFLKAMLGLLPDSRESVFIEGRYTGKSSRIRHMAYLPQDSFLPKNRKISDSASLFLPPGKLSALEKDGRISSLLDRRADQLSAGEKRYVEVFLIASLERTLYLFDEPFSGIEPLYVERIREKLLDLKDRGKYVLLTDHDFHTVSAVSYCLWLSMGGRLDPVENRETELARMGYLPQKERK